MTPATALKAVEPIEPKIGDTVRATVTREDGRPSEEMVTLVDGSMIISPEQIARFGGGDLGRGRKELRRLIAVERDQNVRQGPATRPSSVRIATVADEEAVFQLVMMDLKENAEIVAPINPKKVRKNLHATITGEGGPKGIIGLMDGPDKQPVAVGVLAPYQWFWSEQWYFHEVFAYVHPDHRHSHYIGDLIQFMRWSGDEFSRQLGYRTFVLFGVLGWKRVRSKIMLYRRKLMMNGAMFIYPHPFPDKD